MKNLFKFFFTIKVKTIRDDFKRWSLTPEFKTSKELIKYPSDCFTEATDDGINKNYGAGK